MPRRETTFGSNARTTTTGFEEARVTLPLLSHPGSELPGSEPSTGCYLPPRRPARPQAHGNLTLTPGPNSNQAEATVTEAGSRGAELERGPRFAAHCTPQPAPSKLQAWVGGCWRWQPRHRTKMQKARKGDWEWGEIHQTLVPALLSSSATNNDSDGPAGRGLRSKSRAGVRESAT